MKQLDKIQMSERIQQIMKRVGITQKGLADYLNISQPAISLYLQGRVPPADVLLKIARLGDTTIEWILTGETDQSKRIFKIGEEKIVFGSDHVLHELWNQLPENTRHTFITLLKQFVERAQNE
jgi:transcriptional regulator with XRE-family HTH domain